MKLGDKIFFSILGLLIFGASIGYTFVFAGGITGKIEFKTSNNIFPDSFNLNSNRIYITASDDISDISISGDCGVVGKYVEKNINLYSFDIQLSDEICDMDAITVEFIKGNFSLKTKYNIVYSDKLFTQYIDYDDEKLNDLLDIVKAQEEELTHYKSSYDSSIHKDLVDYIVNKRKHNEIQYMKAVVSDLISKRQVKYQIPVKGVGMATKSSKLPNSGRPYRASYTEGIHEGWDFDTNFGNTVSAIDYGVIVRVVNNFTYSDLGKIKDTGDITILDKMWNLDTLRGNQVWLKTSKGDLAFYAHLNEVFPDIKEGMVVFKGQPLGTVGITGVPDKNYNDYHLHLELRKTPYELDKLPYTYEDYMSWPWYFKGETEKYILENQYNIFQKYE